VAPARPDAEGDAELGSVIVRDDPDLTRELVDRFHRTGVRPSVSVSDLVAPRRAFWRRQAGPPPVSAERAAILSLGRDWHRTAGRLLAAEGRLEVRLRKEGISCRIDLLADVPVEIKTGATPVGGHVAEERPEHVEQLGMYCTLLGQDRGRLIHMTLSEGRCRAVRATDVSFGDAGRLEGAMRSREAALRAALDRGVGAALPRCRWFGRGCEFQEGRVCDCRGDEPLGSTEILDAVRGVADRPDIADRWCRALGAAPEPGPGPARFRDLLYLRRAYFERVRGSTGEGPAAGGTPPRVGDLYHRLLEAVESGPVGEVRQLPSASDAPEEEVVGFRDAPFLLRTSRAGARLDPRTVATRVPQYGLELGFRCAATETSLGRVVVGYERAESDSDRLHVLEYRFPSTAEFARLAHERARRLAEAIALGTPGALEPCPGWMVAGCPYREECGCDAGGSRSQR
jgi:hypothetical protein